MKKLALLLAVLPLAACATSQDRLAQASEAKTTCTANHEGPTDPHYTRCVNQYLQAHYGWQVVTLRDGSLGISHHHYVGTPAYF
ncbi:MAG TPA: hypothetical protein VN723_15540 [Rhizomicrobium sp.]|nr:hypothetical protein [Rhizomicrobium sp.]